MFTSLLQDPY